MSDQTQYDKQGVAHGETIDGVLVPDITAPWHPDIAEFALSFDGYRFARGNREYLSALADGLMRSWYQRGVFEWLPGCMPCPPTLNELRAALFFEQRNYRWNETEPQGKELRYMRALVAAIANRVKEGEQHD